MSKKGLVKKVGADGKSHLTFPDRERYDDIVCETGFTPEEDPQTALYMGGPELKILIASANVGNAPILEMDSWVPRNAPGTDVVVFGLQESTYGAHEAPNMDGIDAATRKQLEKELGAEKGQHAKEAAVAKEVVVNPQDVAAVAEDAEDADDADLPEATGHAKLSGAKHLLASLQRQVGPDFVLLKAVVRGQMRLRVYVRKELRSKVSGVEAGAENTGLGGVVANKGGQAIKFDLAGTSLVFVNSHLAAHESAAKCNKRDEDVNEIFNGIKFGDKVHDLTQFNHVFWCGDLNYRLEPPGHLPKAAATQKVHALIEENNLKELWAMDELLREVKAGRAYCNFRTPRCEFKPTFKVARNAGIEYNPKRIPSYCDRVLWKSHRSLDECVKCHSFRGCHKFATSDHKPVLGRFSVSPTPPLVNLPSLTGPLPFNTGGASVPVRASMLSPGQFGFFPQLKFFDLEAHDLTAMDTGMTLQQVEAKGAAAAAEDVDDAASVAPSEADDASVSGVSFAATDVTKAVLKPTYVPPVKRNRGWTVGAAKSDPYVVCGVYPPQLKAAEVSVKTEIKKQTLNPVWEATPVLSLKASAWEGQLEHATLRLTVFDNDVGSDDDVIGCVDFSFKELAKAADGEGGGVVSFKRDVVFNGRLHGFLTGKIEVNVPGPSGSFPNKHRCVDDSATLSMKLRPGVCCAIS